MIMNIFLLHVDLMADYMCHVLPVPANNISKFLRSGQYKFHDFGGCGFTCTAYCVLVACSNMVMFTANNCGKFKWERSLIEFIRIILLTNDFQRLKNPIDSLQPAN